MPRPKGTTEKIRMHVVLDPVIWAKCFLLIHDSNYERGFPPGAFSDLVEKALQEYFNKVGVGK